jgi:hypothetical protein
VVSQVSFKDYFRYSLQGEQEICRFLRKSACALHYTFLRTGRATTVSPDGDDTMTQNHNSDIRLGSQLLTTATMICTGFAVAALVVYLRGDSISVQANNESPTPTSTEQQLSAELTEQEQLEDIRMAEVVAAAPSPFDGIEQNIRTVARHRPRHTQVVSQTNTTSHERSYDRGTALPGKHGVYVPVNVHPVTVNIDGSVFSEQLTRVAKGVDQMLASHRTVLSSKDVVGISRSADESGHNKLSRQEERLTQIGASLRELSVTVESLRTQSQAATANQNDSRHQAELATQLMVQFQNTLTEHRQLLADASRTVSLPKETSSQVLPEVETVPVQPELDELPSMALAKVFIEEPVPVIADVETWDDSIESDELLLSAEPELQIELEPQLNLEANELTSEPVALEPLLPEAVEPSIVPAPNLQLMVDPIGMNSAVDVIIPDNRVPELDDSQDTIRDRSSAPALVEADVVPQELHLPLFPEESVAVVEQTPEIPGAAPVIPRTEQKIAYEQNYRFALPPASDPSPFTAPIVPPVQVVHTTQMSQPLPVEAETRTPLFPKLIFGSRKSPSSKSKVRNRKYGRHSNRQVATRAARPAQFPDQPQGDVALMPTPAPPATEVGMKQTHFSHTIQTQVPVAPTHHAAAPVHRHMPDAQQPVALHNMHGTRPHPMRQVLSDGIDAATDFGRDVRDRTTGMLSSLSGPRRPATQPQTHIQHQHAYHQHVQHQHAQPQHIQYQHAHYQHAQYQNAEHKQTGVLHRVSAAIRGVGRSRSVK